MNQPPDNARIAYEAFCDGKRMNWTKLSYARRLAWVRVAKALEQALSDEFLAKNGASMFEMFRG